MLQFTILFTDVAVYNIIYWMKNIAISFNILCILLGGGILIGAVVTTIFFKRKYMTHFSWVSETLYVDLYVPGSQ